MAILKHIASKNADYGEAQRYLMFQHDEYTGKPILDENGRLIPREEYYLDGINCDPFTFDMECKELNAQYGKTRHMMKSSPTIMSSASIRKMRQRTVLPGSGHSSLVWNMPAKIFPDIRLLSAPIQTDTTRAAISMCISSSTA